MVSTSIGIEIIRSPILPVIKFLYIKCSGLMSNVAGRKRSEIWNYFTISVSEAICYECQDSVAQGGDENNSFNTSNLQKHLRNHHPDKLRELEEGEKEASKKKAAAKEQASSSQATLDECIEWSRPYPIDHPMAQRGSLVLLLR